MVRWSIAPICLFILGFFILVLLMPSVLSASQSGLVKLTGELVNGDFVCEATYLSTPSNTPRPDWFWYGPGGSIDGEYTNKLSRAKFTRGQNIQCKYIDPANLQNLELNTIIPNSPPIIHPIGLQTVKKGKILNVRPIVSDPDGDEVQIIYSMPFNDEGKWENNLQYDVGVYPSTITAIDPFGAVSSIEFKVELADQLVTERSDYNLQFQNKQVASQQTISDGQRRYSKKFTLIKAGNILEVYPDLDPQKPLVTISRILFSISKDKLKLGFEINSLGTIAPTGTFSLNGIIYDYVQLRAQDFSSNDLKSMEIEFKVPVSWLLSNKVDKEAISLNVFDSEWMTLPTKIVAEADDYVYYSASSDLFGIYAVAGNSGASVKSFPVSVESGEIIVGGAVVADADEQGKSTETEKEYLEKYYGEQVSDKDWTRFFLMFLVILIAVVVVAVFVIRAFAPRGSVADKEGNIRGGLTKEDFNEISEGKKYVPTELSETEIKQKVKQILAGEKEIVEEELKERGLWRDDESDEREIDVNKELGFESKKTRNDALERSKEIREKRNQKMNQKLAEEEEKNRIKYWGEM